MDLYNLPGYVRMLAILLNLFACCGFGYAAYKYNKVKQKYLYIDDHEMAKLMGGIAWSNTILCLVFLALTCASVYNYLR